MKAGILVLLPASSYAADASGKSPKPVVLESGLAYVEKKTKDGLLASVEQKVGQVSRQKSFYPSLRLSAHTPYLFGQGDLVIVDYIAYLRDGGSPAIPVHSIYKL